MPLSQIKSTLQVQEPTLADAPWSLASIHLHVSVSGQVLHQQECNSMVMVGHS